MVVRSISCDLPSRLKTTVSPLPATADCTAQVVSHPDFESLHHVAPPRCTPQAYGNVAHSNYQPSRVPTRAKLLTRPHDQGIMRATATHRDVGRRNLHLGTHTRLEHAIEHACKMAGRDLTTTEWQENFGNRPYGKTRP